MIASLPFFLAACDDDTTFDSGVIDGGVDSRVDEDTSDANQTPDDATADQETADGNTPDASPDAGTSLSCLLGREIESNWNSGFRGLSAGAFRTSDGQLHIAHNSVSAIVESTDDNDVRSIAWGHSPEVVPGSDRPAIVHVQGGTEDVVVIQLDDAGWDSITLTDVDEVGRFETTTHNNAVLIAFTHSTSLATYTSGTQLLVFREDGPSFSQTEHLLEGIVLDLKWDRAGTLHALTRTNTQAAGRFAINLMRLSDTGWELVSLIEETNDEDRVRLAYNATNEASVLAQGDNRLSLLRLSANVWTATDLAVFVGEFCQAQELTVTDDGNTHILCRGRSTMYIRTDNAGTQVTTLGEKHARLLEIDHQLEALLAGTEANTLSVYTCE